MGVRFDYYAVVGEQPDITGNPNRPDLYGSLHAKCLHRFAPGDFAEGAPEVGASRPGSESHIRSVNSASSTSTTGTSPRRRRRTTFTGCDTGTSASGGNLEFVGNAFLPLPKTISYEIGYEHDFEGVGRVTMSGYYKDARDQPQFVFYSNGNPESQYFTYEPLSYWTQKGFEFRFLGRSIGWLNGFANLSWFLNTYGINGTTNIRPDDPDQEAKNIAVQARTPLETNL